jgi:hypothetical protein
MLTFRSLNFADRFENLGSLLLPLHRTLHSGHPIPRLLLLLLQIRRLAPTAASVSRGVHCPRCHTEVDPVPVVLLPRRSIFHEPICLGLAVHPVLGHEPGHAFCVGVEPESRRWKGGAAGTDETGGGQPCAMSDRVPSLLPADAPCVVMFVDCSRLRLISSSIRACSIDHQTRDCFYHQQQI